LLASAWLLGARSSGAQPAAPPKLVSVTIAGEPQQTQQLQKVLSELLGRLGVSVTYTRSEDVQIAAALAPEVDAPPSLARVWVDLRNPKTGTVYIADQADRLLARQVPRKSPDDEVAREEVAHIVESTVDALLSGGHLGVAADLPPPAPPPAPVLLPRRAATQGANVSLGYEAQAWSASRAPVHGPFVSIGVFSVRKKLRLGVRLSAQMRFPSEIEQPPVGVRLDHGALRLMPEIEVGLGRSWVMKSGIGAGVDMTYVEPEAAGGGVAQLDGSRWTATPVARALLGVGYAPASGRSVALLLAGDVDLLGTRYYVDRPDGAVDIFRPWRIRPTIALAFGLDLFAP
jgi:hypothetical protein